MREIELAAIESGRVTGLELMERAGQGVVDAIFETWPDLNGSAHRAVVLCGPGNNGGDGFVVARLLKMRGWTVRVVMLGHPEKLPPDAKTNYERWIELGSVEPYVDEGDGAFRLEPLVWTTDTVMVDALFGTGLVRGLKGLNAAALVTQISEWRLDPAQRTGGCPGVRVVAVDIPSGLSADTGCYLEAQDPDPRHWNFRADLTVSFHRAKKGHKLGDGPSACGTLVVKDIGL
jgi:hydroxyethylthiazole kinase-like uncharacterized protein yjeF